MYVPWEEGLFFLFFLLLYFSAKKNDQNMVDDW